MSEKNVSIKKASTYYLLGNLFNKGMSFITVPIFTRILTTADYGIVTTFNSWVTILSMVLGCALYMGIRAAFIDYRDKVCDFVSAITSVTIIIYLIAFLCGTIFLYIIDLNGTHKILLYMCIIYAFSSTISTNFTMYLMMEYKYKLRTALMILPNLVSVIFSVIAVMFFMNDNLYLGRVIPTTLVHLLFAIFMLIIIYKKSRKLFNLEYVKYAMAISLPLVVHGIALNIMSQADRTMITVLADASQTGIYSLVYNFSMLATVITTALEGVWVPWFTKKLIDRECEEINERSKEYTTLITCAMIGLILVGVEILKLLAPQKYWEGIYIIPPVVLANYGIFLYTFYVNIEHFHKKTIYITFNTIFAAIANIVLNFIFIPKYGYVAAAYTTLVTYIIAFVLHARYAKKLESGLYPITYFIKPLLQILLSIVLFYMFIDNVIVRWTLAFVYILVVAIVNREKIFMLFPKLKHKG